MEQLSLPYYLDRSDPDVMLLRRKDGSFVAAFSVRGATTEGIVEAAKEDYGRLFEDANPLVLGGERVTVAIGSDRSATVEFPVWGARSNKGKEIVL